MTLWRQVLGALNDPQATGREKVLAKGAAELARTRSAGPAPRRGRRHPYRHDRVRGAA